MSDDRVLVHVRIPESLLTRLDEIADERVVSRNLIVTQAIDQLLTILQGPMESDVE